VKRLILALVLLACNPTPKEAAKAEPTSSTTSTSTASGSAGPVKAGDKIRVIPAAQDSDALSLIRTERLRAKAEGRVLVVYVSATWCDPCKKLKEEIEAGRLDDRYGKTTLLAFDADKDIDRLGSAGYTFKFVPYVALPGPDGRPADTQEATGKGSNAWKELLGKLDAWQAQSGR
jgi:thiol-disulfide isomerase/thioredoxin